MKSTIERQINSLLYFIYVHINHFLLYFYYFCFFSLHFHFMLVLVLLLLLLPLSTYECMWIVLFCHLLFLVVVVDFFFCFCCQWFFISFVWIFCNLNSLNCNNPYILNQRERQTERQRKRGWEKEKMSTFYMLTHLSVVVDKRMNTLIHVK